MCMTGGIQFQCTLKKRFNARFKCNLTNSNLDRSNVTLIKPGVQGAFLHLHCSVFVSDSSCFSFSSANNARVLFLFEEAA